MMKKYRRPVAIKLIVLLLVAAIGVGVIIVTKQSKSDNKIYASTESDTTKDSTTMEEAIRVDSTNGSNEDTSDAFKCSCHKTADGESDNVLQYDDKVYGVFCSESCPNFRTFQRMHNCNNIVAIDAFNGNLNFSHITVYGNMTVEYGQNHNEQGLYYYAVVGDYNSVEDCLIAEKNKKAIN